MATDLDIEEMIKYLTSCSLVEVKGESKDEGGVDIGFSSVERLNLGPKKQLLVMGLGGLLCHRVYRYDKSQLPTSRLPDSSYGSFYVYKRPHCEDFIKFCLERFVVGIWTSAKEWYMDNALNCVMGGLRYKYNLLFEWDQDECTKTEFMDLENNEKPIFLLELKKKIWGGQFGAQFSPLNTLLIDREPYKALLNPPHTGIFPAEYEADLVDDNVLGDGSELRMYLKELAKAEDVPSYVKQYPYGKPAISPDHAHWDYYSKIITKYQN